MNWVLALKITGIVKASIRLLKRPSYSVLLNFVFRATCGPRARSPRRAALLLPPTCLYVHSLRAAPWPLFCRASEASSAIPSVSPARVSLNLLPPSPVLVRALDTLSDPASTPCHAHCVIRCIYGEPAFRSCIHSVSPARRSAPSDMIEGIALGTEGPGKKTRDPALDAHRFLVGLRNPRRLIARDPACWRDTGSDRRGHGQRADLPGPYRLQTVAPTVLAHVLPVQSLLPASFHVCLCSDASRVTSAC